MNHTIAAIATAPGEGGIGIIRISGDDSFKILKNIFRYPSGKEIDHPEPRKMIYGNIISSEYNDISQKDSNSEIYSSYSVIDECMAVYMKAPHTYTGEDVVEIQCHGSTVSLRKILSLVLSKGAGLAEHGEFTKRAFLNGRIDLSQAEAVIDLIRAKSEDGLASAVSQLHGSVSQEIRSIRKKMADLLSDIIVHIEYPEEDLEELLYDNLILSIDDIYKQIDKLYGTADTGRMLKDGIRIAIIGRPNVGKSSLLNCLLKENRAIVTDIPGTTRDTIEESALIGGIPVRMVDTAGIRETEDRIEQIGIQKSMESLQQADIILLLFDASESAKDIDRDFLKMVEGKKYIVLLNKTDLGISTDNISSFLVDSPPAKVIPISVLRGDGISELIQEIQNYVYGGKVVPEYSLLISNVRHEELLRQSLQLLQDARGMLEQNEALDFAECDIREAWMKLGEITGEAVTDDIVSEVFSRFCLGK